METSTLESRASSLLVSERTERLGEVAAWLDTAACEGTDGARACFDGASWKPGGEWDVHYLCLAYGVDLLESWIACRCGELEARRLTGDLLPRLHEWIATRYFRRSWPDAAPLVRQCLRLAKEEQAAVVVATPKQRYGQSGDLWAGTVKEKQARLATCLMARIEGTQWHLASERESLVDVITYMHEAFIEAFETTVAHLWPSAE